MNKLFLFFGICFCLHAEAQTQQGEVLIKKVTTASELVLRLNYEVKCNEGAPYPGLTGTVHYQGRDIRFDLFSMKNFTEMQLGKASELHDQNATYEVDASSDCKLLQFYPELLTYDLQQISITDAQALSHSPYLVIRDDQYKNRFTDTPLEMVYSIKPVGKNFEIKYTLFFSDEDSEVKPAETEEHQARYGRRTDIEWVYKIEIDQNNQVVSDFYQGSLTNGVKKALVDKMNRLSELNSHSDSANSVMGRDGGTPDITHTTVPFRGEFLPGSHDHPVLYNIAINNVFSDRADTDHQAAKSVGYHLVPRRRVDYPYARELVMFHEPWMFQVSDAEMIREKKLFKGEQGMSDQYLYVLLEGDLNLGSPMNNLKGFRAIVDIQNVARFAGGSGTRDIDRLGEDMWARQEISGIPLGREILARIGKARETTTVHGSFHLEKTMLHLPVDLKIDKVRFFKLVPWNDSYKTVEVTGAFQDCRVGSLKNVNCEL